MIGLITFSSPVYVPTSFSVSVVLSSSSRTHWFTADWLLHRISVCCWTWAMAASATIVLPAPHGSTTTPCPPAGLPCMNHRDTPSFW